MGSGVDEREIQRRKERCLACANFTNKDNAVLWCSRCQHRPDGTYCEPWAAAQYREALVRPAPWCGPWRDGSDWPAPDATSTRVFAAASVYYAAEIVPHFIKHYEDLGVTRILLACRNRDVFERVQAYAQGHRARVSFKDTPHYATMDKERYQLAMLQEEYLHRNDWVMHVDIDEFQEYPVPLMELVEDMNLHNDWAIRGHLVDRIAADGLLRPILPSPSIFEQFPIEAHVTQAIRRGWTQKIMLARARVRLAGGGHHDTLNARYSRVPVGLAGDYRVHHFKWTAGVDDDLAARGRTGGVSVSYAEECRRFLRHYREHARISLSTQGMNARYAGPMKAMAVYLMRNSEDLVGGLHDLMRHIGRVDTLIEVGCFAGESTAILSGYANRLIAIDPWEGGYSDMDGASHHDFRAVWNAFRSRSYACPVLPVRAASPAAAEWFAEPVDMVYIDGCHTEEAVRADIAAWSRRCRILAGHDYPNKPGVKRAVDALVGRVKLFRDGSWLRV